MRRHRFAILVVIALAVCASVAPAATLRVEKDGSGDFTIIQDAVNASSAGDTILIGQGRYDDFHTFVAPAWETEVIVDVNQDDLTFIGAGRDLTIIGPVEMYLTGSVPEPMAVATVDTVTATFVEIGFENARDTIYWAHGRLKVEDCRFTGYRNGMYVFCEDGIEVRDSEFYSELPVHRGIVTHSPCGPVTVSGCDFGGLFISEAAISINGTSSVSIDGCSLILRNGVFFSGSTGTVTNCTTTSEMNQAIWVHDASQVHLAGNQLHGNYAAIYINGWSVVTGSGNRFTGGTDLATIHISSQSEVTLNGNEILRAGQYAAHIGQYFYEIMTNDLRDNYWGTTDPDSVAAWVWDYEDDPVTRAYIDYLPIAETPLPANRSSLGGLKALFR